MAITRAKKGEILDSLSKVFKTGKSFIFLNFRGLKVSDTTAMRQALKKDQVSYLVAKKSLVERVLEGEKLGGSKPELEGELALAWGEDLVAPARGVHVFQKKFPGMVKILGGIFEGKFMDKAEMEEIALIPSLDVLRGKFVNIINSPIQRFVIGLSEIAKTK